MTMANLSHLTDCGLSGISRIPFGMHACHFYSSRDELVAALVPYSVSGLLANERCIWVTAPPLSASEAVQALRDAWHDVDDRIQAGALRILESTQLKEVDLVQLWLDEEERALSENYSGLRIAGNANFFHSGGWSTLMRCERAVTEQLNIRRIITLCSYPRMRCHGEQLCEVMSLHHCTLEPVDADWQVCTDPEWGARRGL